MDKVIDIEDRIPSMREKRRRRTNKKFLLLLTLFILVLLFLLYFQSPLSKVNDITINDTVLQEGKVYKDNSGLFKGQSLWGFKKSDIEKKLRKVPGVKDADVSREFLNNISVHITEWKPIAFIEDQNQFHMLLENGDLLEHVEPHAMTNAPILSGFDEKRALKLLIAQLQEMDSSVHEQLSQITYKSEDRIQVYMNDGNEVHAVLPTFAEKMTYYPDIAAQLPKNEKGVIDMEIGVYFKSYSDYYQGLEAGAVNEQEGNEQ